jgi:hypothetical protein
MVAAALTCISSQGAAHAADLWSYLTPELGEIVRADTDGWIKRLRAVPFDGRTMRERFSYRQDSLWWFTELYLHKSRRLEAAIATVLSLDAAREQHAPASILLETDDLVVRDAAHTFGRAHGVPVETRGRRVERHRHVRTSYLAGLTATLSRVRPLAPVFLPTPTVVAAFVQTAFRRATEVSGQRPPSYVPQVLGAIADRVGRDHVRCIGVGPRRNLRRRQGRAAMGIGAGLPLVPIEQLAPHGQLGGALEVWRRRAELAQQLTKGDPIRAAARVRQYDLWAVLHRELEAVALLQWPWAARAMDEAAAALGAIKPEIVVTHSEPSAWGRALLLEARRTNTPSVAILHDVVSPSSFAFSHEPDEVAALGADRGRPAPTRWLVFDQQTATHLDDAGHFSTSRIVVTGHPRSDGARVARLARMTDQDRRDFRRSLGVSDDQRLAILVARLGELGGLLDAIVASAVAQPGVHLAIKVHQADAPVLYDALPASAPNVSLVPDSVDLPRLLAGADGLVTRESAVAVDALSLGVPSLVVGAPDHLGPLVDAGIMLGATTPEAVGPAFDALLYDDHVRRRLRRVVGAESARDESTSVRAADRAADAILELRSQG